MGSILNLHSFYFFLILACSFLEIYGRGGFGGGRGGSGGGRGGSRGGYRSRSSSGSSASSRYKPSSGSSSGSSSSGSSGSSSSSSSISKSGGNYGSKSGGTSKSSANQGSSFRAIPIYINHNHRMNEDILNLNRINDNYDRKSQEHHESKIDAMETRRPWIYRYTTSRPRNILKAKPRDNALEYRNWRKLSEPSDPFQGRIDEINENSRKMKELSVFDSYGDRRNRFQKRHICEGSQCFHEGGRKMGDDITAVNPRHAQNSKSERRKRNVSF
ncbi:uncharacterized protein [Parasteatoda tepidariorum]|uniref:uncharacterized protein n=1 Tax=Parasteatoda tepidariorum TaxID=114398 RepID=UPI001C7298BB|nr:U3 small nucleolar RNA-associated protein 25 [Parasteatoda tepidariorum]